MRKRIEIDSHLSNGESTVQVIDPAKAGLWAANSFDKVAQTSSALPHVRDSGHLQQVQAYLENLEQYFKTLKSVDNSSILHIIAMTGGEFYGPNNNGDAFYWDGPEGLTKHAPGFTTQANVFSHHQNKDPNKRIGDVIQTFVNSPMRRIELVIVVDHDKCPELPQELSEGKVPVWSMGCRIPYDVCDHCGHKAKNRSEYCSHASNMLQMHQDGRLNFVWNPNPYLFDISKVFRPADRLAFMLRKVARATEVIPSAVLGEREEQLEKRSAFFKKLSELVKALRGETVACRQLNKAQATLLKNLPVSASIPTEKLSALAKLPLSQVLETFSKNSSHFTLPELADLTMLGTVGEGMPKVAAFNLVKLEETLYEKIAEYPWVLDEILETPFLKTSNAQYSGNLANNFAREITNRRYTENSIHEKLAQQETAEADPLELPHSLPGLTTLHVTNPKTGQRFVTNAAAARKGQGSANDKRLAKMVGGSALVGLGYRFLGSRPGGIVLAPLELALGARAVYKAGKKPGPGYKTDEGYSIPIETSMVEKTSSQVSIPLEIMFTVRDEFKHYPTKLATSDQTTEARLAHAFDRNCFDPEDTNLDALSEEIGKCLLGV